MTRRRRDPAEGDSPGPVSWHPLNFIVVGDWSGRGEAKFFGVVPKVQIGRTPELVDWGTDFPGPNLDLVSPKGSLRNIGG